MLFTPHYKENQNVCHNMGVSHLKLQYISYSSCHRLSVLLVLVLSHAHLQNPFIYCFFNIRVRKSFVNQKFLNCSTYELFRNSKDQQCPFHGFLQWMIIGASTARQYHWNWHPWVMGDAILKKLYITRMSHYMMSV